MSNLEQLIEAYDNYIKVLCEELDETVSIASVHGWKSKRAELGILCREEIKLVKEQIQKEEPKTYTQEEMIDFIEWAMKLELDVEITPILLLELYLKNNPPKTV